MAKKLLSVIDLGDFTWKEKLASLFSIEDWHYVGSSTDPIAPAFENSWANVGGTGIPDAAFYKDTYDRVHLRGNVDTGATTNTIFTLPTGYRPPYKTIQTTYNNGGGVVYITVDTDGTVDPAFGAGTDMWLDGVSFRVN